MTAIATDDPRTATRPGNRLRRGPDYRGTFGLPAPLREVAALLVPVLFVLAPAAAFFRGAVIPQDEGTLLVYPQLVLRGAVPNHTFESVYGPGNLFSLAISYAIGGQSVGVERAVGLVYRLALVAGIYFLLRRSGRWRASLGASVAAVAVVEIGGYAALAWLGGLACAVWALALLYRGNPSARAMPAAAGLLAGTAIGFRPDLILALVLGGCLAVRHARKVSRAFLTGGAMLGLVPSLVNLAQAGPRDVIRGELIQPLLVFPAGRRLPLSGDHKAALVAAVALLALCGLAVMVWAVRRLPLQQGRQIYASVALFSVGLIPYYLSRADSPHALAAFAVPVACAALLFLPKEVDRPLVRLVASGTAAGVVLGMVLAVGSSYAHTVLHPAHEYRAVNAGRALPVSDATQARDLTNLFHEVDATAAATSARSLFVGPQDLSKAPYNDTDFYFMLPQLRPSSYFLEMEPGVANVGTRLARDLTHADIVVTSSSYLGWQEPNQVERSRSQEANAVLRRDFRLVWSQSLWRIYVHVGLDAMTPRPTSPSQGVAS